MTEEAYGVAMVYTQFISKIDLTTPPSIAEDEFWRMANLSSQKTGLPFLVWISSGQGARHAARVKVARNLADRPDNMTSVSIAAPATVHGGPPLASTDLRKLQDWIDLNRAVLLDYWNCELATDEVMERLKKV